MEIVCFLLCLNVAIGECQQCLRFIVFIKVIEMCNGSLTRFDINRFLLSSE